MNRPSENGKLRAFTAFLLEYFNRSGSAENFNRKDRLYSTLPVNGVNGRSRPNNSSHNENDSANWSDDEALGVALNGDWVNEMVTYHIRQDLKVYNSLCPFRIFWLICWFRFGYGQYEFYFHTSKSSFSNIM